MFRRGVLSILVCWLFSLVGYGHAAGPLTVSDATARVNVVPFSEVLADPSASLRFPDVLAPAQQKAFTAAGGSLEFGYSDAAYWIRFTVHNQLVDNAWLLLEVDYPLLNELTLYEPLDDGAYREQSLGDVLPFDARRFRLNTFVFRIDVAPGQRKTLYLRVASTSSVSVPLTLYTPHAYYEYLHDHQALLGIFYGICLALLFYYLFLFVSTREANYFYYLGVIVSNMLVASCFDGFFYKLLSGFTYLQEISIIASICIAVGFCLQFTRTYLQLSQTLPRADIAFRLLIGLVIVEFLVHVVFPGKWTASAVLATLGVMAVTNLAVAFRRMRDGYQPARLFTLAWLMLLVPAFLGVCNALNIIELHSMTPYLHKTSVAGMLIVFSFALASRVSVLQQAEQAAREQARQSQAETKAKSEFLAKMSHEIRTPMNGVLGMVELLKDTPLKADQLHYVSTIHHSGQALLGIINDILDYSKIEAGHLALESVAFDLEALMDECVSVFTLQAADKGVSAWALLDPQAPRWLMGDPTRLRQILINLLGNAFKFTTAGQVHLTARVDSSASGTRMMLFEVVDSGIGITPDQQRKLFRSFAQADSSTTRKFGGTGLGLAICKQLVELMGGRIGVRSQPHAGSTFWFSLPLIPAEDQHTDAVAASRAALHGKQLLLVDADCGLLGALRSLAESWGMQVDTAGSAEAALQQFQQMQTLPDIALVSLDLPDQDGLSLLWELGEQHPGPFAQILLTLARKVPLRADLAHRGIAAVLEKPLSAQQLRTTLNRVISGEQQSPTCEKASGSLHTDLSYLSVLVAEDNKVNQMVIVGLLKRLGIVPQLAENGLAVVEAYKQGGATVDLILMDCEMPELDGYDATRQIRQIEQSTGQRAIIIALSAHALSEHAEKSVNAGMDDHLAKPVSLDALVAMLQRWLPPEQRTD